MESAPTNFYSFERNFKAFKSDNAKLKKYLLLITPDHVKQIFKSDLEADSMLNIFKFFLEQDDSFFAEYHVYMLSFVHALQSVKPFDLACEFLMDDETDIIKNLISKIDTQSGKDDSMIKAVKDRFQKVSGIEF